MRTNKILLSAVVLIAAAGVIFWAASQHTSPAPTPAGAASVVSLPATSVQKPSEPAPAAAPAVAAHDSENSAPLATVAAAPVPAAEARSAADEVFDQSLDLLVSPQASLQQKQAVWNQLRNSGQLGRAIAALEERQQADPTSAEIPTQLGMAYLLNISATSDVREQGIGGMKADMSFDAALKLDPTNWEAQFFKASALTHWPDSMNTGPQVIQRFTTLIQQQEAQPPRPEFVQSYVLLGDQYQKSGQPDAARQAWGRGLSLFPTSQTLSQRLNPAP